MFVGTVAVTLNLMSVAVLAFVISVVFLSLASRLTLSRLAHFTFGIRKAILWSLVSAPWWIAASCVALFWPRQQDIFPTAWLNELAHWHHVDVFSYTSWHGVTLLCASVYLLWSIACTVNHRMKQYSTMTNLIALSAVESQQSLGRQRYFSLPLDIPAAFTTGLLSPKIYLTTALQAQVSAQELDIIVRHEVAHVAARDPLFKVIFATFAGFFPAVVSNELIKHFTLLTEQMADSAVTGEYDNLDVAQTLINVARIQCSVPLGCDGLQSSYFGNDQTSMRVQYLISPVSASSRLALGLALILFASAPLLTASVVDGLHHLIETFFTH